MRDGNEWLMLRRVETHDGATGTRVNTHASRRYVPTPRETDNEGFEEIWNQSYRFSERFDTCTKSMIAVGLSSSVDNTEPALDLELRYASTFWECHPPPLPRRTLTSSISELRLLKAIIKPK